MQELVDILELAVDRREAHVGDLVELAEPLHHDGADAGRRNLALLGIVEEGFDLVDDPVELDGRNGPLLAGLREAHAQLVAVEPLAPAVVLDDHVGDLLDRLVGGEPAAAGGALPPAPDHLALPALARIHDTVVYGRAERALHPPRAYPSSAGFCRASVSAASGFQPLLRIGLVANSVKPINEMGTNETACAISATPVAVASGTP